MASREFSSPFVALQGDAITKRYPAGDVELEYQKAERVWRLFEQDERITAPKPIEITPTESAIRYKYLGEDEGLRESYTRFLKRRKTDTELLELLKQAAHALAKLHGELELPTRSEWHVPKAFHEASHLLGVEFPLGPILDAPHAFLHCDFSFSNLRHAGGELRLYDPSANMHTTFETNQHGSIYVDLGTIMASLNGRVLLRHHALIRWSRIRSAKELFLSEYEQASGSTIDAALAEMMGFVIAFASFTRWHGTGIRRRLSMAALYNRLKGNVGWISRIRRSQS